MKCPECGKKGFHVIGCKTGYVDEENIFFVITIALALLYLFGLALLAYIAWHFVAKWW